jgi:hypothetical protein
VVWESGGGEITVGDLPKTLTLTSGGNPAQDRADSLPGRDDPDRPDRAVAVDLRRQSTRKGRTCPAVIRASWTAPTVNTDGTVITDLASYLVRWRGTGRPRVGVDRYVGVTQRSTSRCTIDTDYEVQVAAVDRSGHPRRTPRSATIHASVDTTAPNVPADPVVTSYLGQLRIAWNGKDNAGAAMPTDFAATSTCTCPPRPGSPRPATRARPRWSRSCRRRRRLRHRPLRRDPLRQARRGRQRQQRLGPVGQVSGATVQVADGDIASLNVGKLTAGTMSADVVIGGRFATALTGARVEMNSLGFQKFDTDGVNNLLVSITGTEALLTGIYKTALTGRRIEIGSAGASGEIDFYAPDGTQTFVKGLDRVGRHRGDPVRRGRHRRQHGPAQHPVEPDQLQQRHSGFWHVLESGDNVGGAGFDRLYIDKSNILLHTNSFIVVEDDLTSRLLVDNASGGRLVYWNSAGQTRLQITDFTSLVGATATTTPRWDFRHSDGYLLHGTNVAGVYQETTADGAMNWRFGTGTGWLEFTNVGGAGGTSSPRFRMFNDAGYGNMLTTTRDSGSGIVYTECLSWDNSVYQPLRASGFVVASDARIKTDITDAEFSATDLLASFTVAQFRRKGHTAGQAPAGEQPAENPAAGAQDGPLELGFIAQDLPPELRAGQAGLLGVDVGPTLAVLVKAAQEAHARLAALEQGKK